MKIISNALIFIWQTDPGEKGGSLDEYVVDTAEVMSVLHWNCENWHKVWNSSLIDYWIFWVIFSIRIPDISLPAMDGLNNWCSLTIPIWGKNPETLSVHWGFPSMSFKCWSNAKSVNLNSMYSTGNIREAKWYF